MFCNEPISRCLTLLNDHGNESVTCIAVRTRRKSSLLPELLAWINISAFRILSLEKLGAVFNQAVYPLDYTPRRMIIHKASGNLIVIETDHAAFTAKGKQERRKQLANVSQSLNFKAPSIFHLMLQKCVSLGILRPLCNQLSLFFLRIASNEHTSILPKEN